MYDVLVIGGGTAGLTAAIYVLRAGKSVMVLENETFGGQITSSPKIENFPGFKSISGTDFADSLKEQALSLGAGTDFCRADKIIDNGSYKKVITEYGEYDAKSVIIATGSKHRHLGVKGEEELSGMGVSYCAVCDGAFFKEKVCCVIGGGNAALQSVMHLSSYCSKVYLVHRRDAFRGEERLKDLLSKKENVEFVLNSVVEEIKGTQEVESIIIKDVKTDEIKEIKTDGVFIAIGQVPDNSAFSDIVALDGEGYIIAGEDCKTSCEGIFAAGDCRTKSIRQLTTASADGSVAGLAACTE
ncbi:MAG: FAD-dependent oxidoreductase [Ruminococcaceae bacterium]|nr:FAD-dependent oxidoreductase [Oscillospiraceae bacterium]